MSFLTHEPESMVLSFEWKTDVIVSQNGNEQRIAVRQEPRQFASLNYLADSNEEVQFWKKEMVSKMDNGWQVPLWHEAVDITAAITASDTTVSADFTKMDDELGRVMLLIHPDGETHELITVTLPRTSTTATLATGTIQNSYPLEGTRLIPVLRSYIDNNSSYTPMTNNAAAVSANFTGWEYPALDGKSAPSLPTHQSNLTINPGSLTRYLLDRRPLSDGSSEVFEQKITRLDYDHAILLKSAQPEANIISGRSYLMDDVDERQFWKNFLGTIMGQQKSFYTQTWRHDMTVSTQPAQGGTSFVVLDDSSPDGIWDATLSHSELAIYTADGTIQYVTIDPATTIDNGNGTHTVSFLPALTNTPDGSNVLRVSFLELVRLASDTVEFELGHLHHKVSFAVRTIEA